MADDYMMQMLCCLFLHRIKAVLIPGIHNTLEDHLSHSRLHAFLSEM